jgi:hypothetical protein
VRQWSLMIHVVATLCLLLLPRPYLFQLPLPFPFIPVIAHLPPHFPFRFLFVCFLTVVRTAA